MRRPHRRVHRLIWPALAVAVALGLGLALEWRPALPIESAAGAAGMP